MVASSSDELGVVPVFLQHPLAERESRLKLQGMLRSSPGHPWWL